jgi:hypothetical protein
MLTQGQILTIHRQIGSMSPVLYPEQAEGSGPTMLQQLGL